MTIKQPVPNFCWDKYVKRNIYLLHVYILHNLYSVMIFLYIFTVLSSQSATYKIYQWEQVEVSTFAHVLSSSLTKIL